MTRLDQLELRLLTRKIVYVFDYFDDDGTCPWNYVERDGKGGFEVFTTVLVSRPDDCDEAVPIALGTVTTRGEARRLLQSYEKWTDACERLQGKLR